MGKVSFLGFLGVCLLLANVVTSCRKILLEQGKQNIVFVTKDGWFDASDKKSDSQLYSHYGWLGYISSGTSWTGTEIPDYYNIEMDSFSNYQGPVSVWPQGGSVSYFAYSPFANQSKDVLNIILPDYTKSDYPLIKYISTEDVSMQEDFQFGAVMNVPASSHPDIEMLLDHKLTRLDFFASLASNPNNMIVTIDKITICGVKMEATYSYAADRQNSYTDAMDWDSWKNPWIFAPSTPTADIDLSSGNSVALSSVVPIKIGNHSAYFIPQQVGPFSDCYKIKVEYSINSTHFVKNVALPATCWGAGQHVKYYATLNPSNAQIDINVYICPWHEEDVILSLGSNHRVVNKTPMLSTLLSCHLECTNFADLWTNVYMGPNGSNYASSSDLNALINSSKRVRIMSSIFNVEKLAGGLYNGERILQMNIVDFDSEYLDIDNINLGNFVDGDVLIFNFPKTPVRPFSIRNSYGNKATVGPATDEGAYDKYEWISRVYCYGKDGELVDSTRAGTAISEGLKYNELYEAGFIIIRRTNLNNHL